MKDFYEAQIHKDTAKYTGIYNFKEFANSFTRRLYTLNYGFFIKYMKWCLIIKTKYALEPNKIVDENNLVQSALLMSPFGQGLEQGYSKISEALKQVPDRQYVDFMTAKIQESKLNRSIAFGEVFHELL